MDVEEIYGIEYVQKSYDGHFVEDWGTSDPSEQYWRRKELPEFMLDHNILVDDSGRVSLTKGQLDFADQEYDRIDQGFFFMSNGKPVYITGKHYFFLRFWVLENGMPPDYRDADRRWFLFLDHWESVPWCRGVIRGKKRREGASSQATSNMVREAILYKNANIGMVSKTNQDAKDTYLEMIQYGFRNLPAFLKPAMATDETNKTEMVFQVIEKGKQKKTSGVSGNNSKISYKPTKLNSYDRARLTRVLVDEGGKFPPDVPFSKFLSIIKETLSIGAKRVGFCEAPSTVNEMTKHGGAEYKISWDEANQFEHEGQTGNTFVRYFSPAYEAMEGFIDKFGMSVIDAPTEEQRRYLAEVNGIDYGVGARQYILDIRARLKGESLEEEIRKFPMDEVEMFMSANTGCVFNSQNINRQIMYLKDESPVARRRVRFFETGNGTVDWVDDANGFWHVVKFPDPPNRQHTYDDGRLGPAATHEAVIGIDGYSNSQGGRKYGSKI